MLGHALGLCKVPSSGGCGTVSHGIDIATSSQSPGNSQKTAVNVLIISIHLRMMLSQEAYCGSRLHAASSCWSAHDESRKQGTVIEKVCRRIGKSIIGVL